MLSDYEWNFSITLYDFFVGSSAFIGSLAIVISSIKWLANKLNNNTTIIKSILPYLKIGNTRELLPITSQHEFSQIIRDIPLDVLQIVSIAYFIRFNSKDKNENKVVYKSYCKPRLGIKLLFKLFKDNTVDVCSKKFERAKSYLFNGKQYEDYIFKNRSVSDTDDTIHKLECEIPLDPIRFLPFYRTVSIYVKIENSNKSHTSWCTSKLNIEEKAIESCINKMPKFKTQEEIASWLKTWKEEFDKNNKTKFDLSSST